MNNSRPQRSSKRIYWALFIALMTGLIYSVYLVTSPDRSLTNFRTAQSPLKASRFSLDLKGLKDMKMSGSGRLSQEKIKRYFKDIPKPVAIIDVRAEKDYFVKGIPASWLGIRVLENGFEDRLKTTSFLKLPLHHIKWSLRRIINLGFGYDITPATLLSEEQFLKDNGFLYFCFEGKRHCAHTPEAVQKFLDYLETQPEDIWIHFHCANGRGRTTTFMILYDIYKNARITSLENIILRQHLLGGENVFDVALRPKGTWSKTDLLKRKELVEKFYTYMTAKSGYPKIKWIDWINQKAA